MNARLLIVDDDPMICKTLKKWAKIKGCEPFVAASAGESYEILAHQEVDLVLTDLRLSADAEDGLVLAKDLLDQDHTRPVILMTGYADLQSARRAIEVGIFEYMVKPFDFQELENSIFRGLIKRQVLTEMYQMQWQMACDVDTRTRELEISNQKLQAEIQKRDWQEKQRAKLEKELASQRLRAANADRLHALGEMAAGVAHELNQPLTAISAITERLILSMERGVPVSETNMKEMFEDILHMVERMTDIIGHMQVFSRDTSESQPIVFDVNRVICDAFKFVGAQLKSHGIRVVIDLPQSLPECLGWPQQIEEVLLNLLTNARHALDEKMDNPDGRPDPSWEPRIDIRVGVLPDGQMVMVSISDTGNGIPKKVLPRIFDPFFTTKEVGKGTGLGLSIAHSIVTKHRGSFNVENRIGEGVTFTFTLPIYQARNE